MSPMTCHCFRLVAYVATDLDYLHESGAAYILGMPPCYTRAHCLLICVFWNFAACVVSPQSSTFVCI
jgi:hypothetical protein